MKETLIKHAFVEFGFMTVANKIGAHIKMVNKSVNTFNPSRYKTYYCGNRFPLLANNGTKI